MTRFLLRALTILLFLPAAFPGPPGAASAVDAAALKALKARSIGPGVMGGRVSDIAFDPSDPFTFYVALATGGLMKTASNGATFEAVFDRQPVASLGAVAVSPANPKIVWVGTGEANDRNSSGWGDGVYRSNDGGATWTNVGLRSSRTIARIVAHPTDLDTAWVAAMGDLWAAGGERGLFRTTDGGKTWTPLLQAPAPFRERVGCGDVAIHPSDPSTIYATLYARIRSPWSFLKGPDATDGKDIGGIFRSTDGGATWRKLGGGLPPRTARIGLAVFASDPKVLAAIVDTDEGGTVMWDLHSKSGGVFRSEDAGETWTRVSPLNPRPFYFSQIRIDPENARRLYVLGMALHVSEDGGRSFREDLGEKIHPDHHALAIDPNNPKRLLIGSDGGAYQSFDGGKTWIHLSNMAAGQFYRINVDDGDPYRICGGLQDNLNWVGPSRTRSKDGIVHTDWTNIGGGDGFYCVFDPGDPDIVFAESQQGWLHRFNMRTGEHKELRPEPPEGHAAFRFHWNSPLIGSRHAPGAMYLAGNRVFRLTEKGEKWKAISPDLSTQDPDRTVSVGSGAENYGVVYALAESPLKPGLLWAGTDDGKLWRTDDDGGSWRELTPGLPKEARGQWIACVEASPHDAGSALVAVDAHRAGNLAPLVWRTDDGGRRWRSIAADLPPGGPVKVVRFDPVNPSLLYAGTEFGLFVSLDGGGRWLPFGGLPTVAVDDLKIQPREMDLVIGTHGRSLYIVDDLRSLQAMTAENLAQPAFLAEPRRAFGAYVLDGWADWSGKGVFRGENPPEGALISAIVREFTGEELKIAISNEDGTPVANLKMPGTPGINRVSWDLRPTEDLLTDYGGEGRKFVRPGEYTVRMTYGKTEQVRKLRVDIAEGIETR